MAYQFGHVEAYGRLAGKKKKDGNTVSRILAEARREEGSCSHIENPQPHELVWGMTLDEVEARVDEWASQAKDARGHAIRKDALCMVGGVVSLPREQMEEDWEDFKTRAVKWLQNEYGNALLCVIAHLDEAHPHLHFYAVAKDGQRFDSIHEGYRAQNGLTGERGNRELSKNEKADIRARGKFAYAAAMRKWQDRLQEDVGKYYGLARIGPRRRRISRAEYVGERAALQAEGKRLRELEKREAEVAALVAAVEAKNLLAQHAEDAAREAKRAVEAREAAAKQALVEAEQALYNAETKEIDAETAKRKAAAREAAANEAEQAANQKMEQAEKTMAEAEAREAEANETITSAEEREKNAEKKVWQRIKAKLIQVFPKWGETLEQMEAALTQLWAKMGRRPGEWMDGTPGQGGRKGPVHGKNGNGLEF
jgi:chemotaxis protein histidine kinase CheA